MGRMARKVRVEFPGAIYHLTVRANGGAGLFDDDDRRYLLGRIAEAASTYQVRVYLFCLMMTHFHLVVETPRGIGGRFVPADAPGAVGRHHPGGGSRERGGGRERFGQTTVGWSLACGGERRKGSALRIANKRN